MIADDTCRQGLLHVRASERRGARRTPHTSAARRPCLMGLEGMVSKHRESAYRGGRFRHWIKVKNRQHPAFARVQDQFG